MHPILQLGLVLLGVGLLLHQLSFQLLGGPMAYKEATTLAAVQKAFEEDEEKLPEDLAPYKFRINWWRLLNLYQLKLHRDAPRRFRELRQMWKIDEEEYTRETTGEWQSYGAVGLSGSMFFHSMDHHFLLKSLGRTFENRFLHREFLPRYFDYVKEHPDTLLNKILDVLVSFDHRFGDWIKASPSHFIVIENIALGKTDEWEMYDLKPTTYLEPFRDLVPARVQMSGITDVLPASKPVLMPARARAALLARLAADLAFLASLRAVDYSVLLVRRADGSARVALIDCFWSLVETRARLTKAASDTVRLPAQTVTADADGYAREMMKMMEKAVQAREVREAWDAVKEDVVLVEL